MIRNSNSFHTKNVIRIVLISMLAMVSTENICRAKVLEKDRVPASTQQSETLKLVREIYQDDYKAAESAQQKSLWRGRF